MSHSTSNLFRSGALRLLLLMTLSGCEVGRSFFQMSSDSPVPFFGVDLMPRRKTSLRMPQRPSVESSGQGYLVSASRPIEGTVLLTGE